MQNNENVSIAHAIAVKLFIYKNSSLRTVKIINLHCLCSRCFWHQHTSCTCFRAVVLWQTTWPSNPVTPMVDLPVQGQTVTCWWPQPPPISGPPPRSLRFVLTPPSHTESVYPSLLHLWPCLDLQHSTSAADVSGNCTKQKMEICKNSLYNTRNIIELSYEMSWSELS